MRTRGVFNLLVLAIFIAGISFIASILSANKIPLAWQSSNVSICDGRKTYSKASQLYNFESKNYSKGAKAYKALMSNGKQLRLIVDFSRSQDGASKDKYDYKLALSPLGNDIISIKNAKIDLEVAGAMVPLEIKEKNIKIEKGQMAQFLSSSPVSISGDKGWKVEVKSANNCLLRVDGFSGAIDERVQKIAGGSTLESSGIGEVAVPPGLSPIGFADWRTLTPFDDVGVKVLSFNREKSGDWSQTEMDQTSLFEPGVGYFLENTTDQIIKVSLDEPYRVPENISSHTIRKGWNIVYNDLGEDTDATGLWVSIAVTDPSRRSYQKQKLRLGELVGSGLVSLQGFTISRFQNSSSAPMTPVDLASAKIEDSGFLWVYLFNEPDMENLQANDIDLAMKADKDSYEAGEKVRLSFKATNQSSAAYAVDVENQDDPCFLGYVVQKGNKVIHSSFASGVSNCPNWPEQMDLQPGSVIEYNQVWEVPPSLAGEVKIIGYLDQSRTFSIDRKSKQIVVNIEGNE